MLKKYYVILLCLLLGTAFPAHALEDLPSWHEADSKKAIMHFVEKTTDKQSPDFIVPEERIAVFDNDGTLWAEQPIYFQLAFAIDRIKELAPQHPEWQSTEPFKSILAGDASAALKGGKEAINKILIATHSGMTHAEFTQLVEKWLHSAKHPTTGKKYTDMVYQPMLEVLHYLRVHGYKTYIVSGGGIDFMRVFAEEVYGIPPQQVIGTSIKKQFEYRDGNPAITRLPELHFFNDKEGKPVAINQHIGRRPVMAFGNSDGDLQMLQWSAAGSTPNLQVYVHHTDAQREWAYDRESHIGKLDKGLDQAKTDGWVVIDMAKDWSVIYP